MPKLILLLLFFSPILWAYQDGADYCKKNQIDGISRFHKIFDPEFKDETILVHSYLKKTFNPKLPSLIFFPGGPGASPRGSEFDLEHFNIIFFESRGMGCSRPKNSHLFLNPTFYSTKKTAHDVLKLLDDYSIDKAFIYGHSYGTVTASYFAHLFPERTEKLILEGIIGSGGVGIWNSERRKNNLQVTFDNLNHENREKILAYSRSGKLPTNWYSVIGTMMSYLDNGFEIYKDFIANILAMDKESFIPFVKNFYANKGFTNIDPLDSSDGEVVFGMITCQELNGLDSKSSFYLNFNSENLLYWDHDNSTKKQYCDHLNIIKPLPSKNLTEIFNSKIHVPIIYLVGENDGATDLDEALIHLKNRAAGPYVFYVLEKGGHLPNLTALKDDRHCHTLEDCESLKVIRTQKKFFENLLTSKKLVSPSSYNHILPLKWNLEHARLDD